MLNVYRTPRTNQPARLGGFGAATGGTVGQPAGARSKGDRRVVAIVHRVRRSAARLKNEAARTFAAGAHCRAAVDRVGRCLKLASAEMRQPVPATPNSIARWPPSTACWPGPSMPARAPIPARRAEDEQVGRRRSAPIALGAASLLRFRTNRLNSGQRRFSIRALAQLQASLKHVAAGTATFTGGGCPKNTNDQSPPGKRLADRLHQLALAAVLFAGISGDGWKSAIVRGTCVVRFRWNSEPPASQAIDDGRRQRDRSSACRFTAQFDKHRVVGTAAAKRTCTFGTPRRRQRLGAHLVTSRASSPAACNQTRFVGGR